MYQIFIEFSPSTALSILIFYFRFDQMSRSPKELWATEIRRTNYASCSLSRNSNAYLSHEYSDLVYNLQTAS